MKIKFAIISLVALLSILVVADTALAAGFNTSADTTALKESIVDTIVDQNGKQVQIGEAIVVTITATDSVTDTNSSSLEFSAKASGGCGIPQSSGPSEVLNYQQTSAISLSASSPKKQFFVRPIYNSGYTGTRTCKISFTHNASSSSNSEIPGLYGSASLNPIEIEIADAQSKPKPTQNNQSNEDSESTDESEDNEEDKGPVVVDFIEADSGLYTTDNEDIEFEHGEEIKISGTTTPNGLVKLYIYSELQEAETEADEEGNWSYTITDIESGSHRVEAEVTDPETGETTERMQILAFSVAQAQEEVEVVEDEEDQSSNTLWMVISVIILIVVIIVAIVWYKKKHKNQNDSPEQSPPNDVVEPDSIQNIPENIVEPSNQDDDNTI